MGLFKKQGTTSDACKKSNKELGIISNGKT